MRELISRPSDPDRGLDRQALPQITRMLDMRRLHTRGDHDAPRLRLDGDADLRDRRAPAVLDYQHAALLSGLLQWLTPRRPCADVLRGGCDEDARLLRDLQRHGLVVAGYEGEPELVGWLRSLWCDRRVHPSRTIDRHRKSRRSGPRGSTCAASKRIAVRGDEHITVIDPYDDACNTAFVNGLGDAGHRRAVVHAPASSEGLLDEILRALGRRDDRDAARTRLCQRQEWVAAWVCAFDRLDLIVYGAWRLKARDLHWLRELAQTPTVRLWLVSHGQARNLPDLLAIADVVWSWEQFRGYWHTRAHNQRRPQRRARRSHADEDVDAISIDALGPASPRPWAIPQMLLTEGRTTELMGAASQVTYSARYDAANALRLAVRLHDLFSDWRTPAQRTFVLMALKNKLFCEHTWFDWDPALTAVTVSPRVDTRPPIRNADPAIAASAIVATSAPELRVDGEFRIGHDGSHVLLETGETITIAGANRPALRAYLTVTGDSRGQLLKQPEWAAESTTAPTPTDARPLPALCQIAGLIEVRPLVMRVSDDAEPLTIKPTGKPWNCLKPGTLDYRHTAVLSHLLRCLQRDEYPREPLRGSTPDDLQVVHDLYDHGLVIDGAHGRPELEQWPRLLWHRGRVTMPPPSSIRA